MLILYVLDILRDFTIEGFVVGMFFEVIIDMVKSGLLCLYG